ncbi:histidine kinase [Dysgonomonas sp. Marseille-P4677]|uniref:sensor histidine kinase n=1 Tax=Dysgonomonas sp. Marseille-P4677 TaxID=2364790 RepID=UPI00191486EE|nr:histidine kinase [Dysgonomonas sp. Marseille-P4677]MBK5720872.1 histidine kinase [Dysgonomonas sp. Marseille-P4677]
MQIRNGYNTTIRLLTSDDLRIFRHLTLFLFIFFVSAGIVWDMQETKLLTNAFEKYGCLFFVIFLFLIDSYLNIYILIPRLLLKGRWNVYFCSLLGVVAPIMGFIIVVQMVILERERHPFDDINLLIVIINSMSSVLALFLLFAGTTSLVLFKNCLQDMQQSEELESTTLQLELKLLENQINPHFLFNMLNNANIMIKKDPNVASHIIGKLEEILRYQINDNTREKVYLKEEILFLNDFLELEKTRRDYFTYTISENGDISDIQVPPLLFITFVENAVKHNKDSLNVSYVHLFFKITKNRLIFICENSLPSRNTNKQVGGIGLANIQRRLNLLYKDNYSLENTKTDISYTVTLELKL